MKHFTIEEFTASSTAKKLNIDNTPGDIERENMISLVDNILDPIREAWGKPIYVTSGYRCPKLNYEVGGKQGSDHTKGLAADLQPKDKTEAGVRELFDAIVAQHDVPFERVLLEHNKARTTWWVHIAYNPQRNLIGDGSSAQHAKRIIINDFQSNR